MMTPQTLQWWTFEDAPLTSYPDQPAVLEVQPDTERIGVTPEGEDLPAAVIERLRRLVDDDFDNGHCEANGCGGNTVDVRPGGSLPRANCVGYGLFGEADEDTRWTWAAIVVLADGRTVLTCEDCCPDTLYIVAADALDQGNHDV